MNIFERIIAWIKGLRGNTPDAPAAPDVPDAPEGPQKPPDAPDVSSVDSIPADALAGLVSTYKGQNAARPQDMRVVGRFASAEYTGGQFRYTPEAPLPPTWSKKTGKKTTIGKLVLAWNDGRAWISSPFEHVAAGGKNGVRGNSVDDNIGGKCTSGLQPPNGATLHLSACNYAGDERLAFVELAQKWKARTAAALSSLVEDPEGFEAKGG